MTRTAERTTRASRPMVWVACGLAVFGASNFAYLGLLGRSLGPAAAAPVSVLWTLLNAVGIGLYLPLEQEIGRRLSAAAAQRSRAEGLAHTLQYALVSVLVIAVVTLVAHDTIAQHLFSGVAAMPTVLAAGLAGQAVAYLARGLLAGTGRFRRYGVQFVIDGVLRTACATAMFAGGVTSPTTFAWVLVVAPPVASVLAVPLSAMSVFRRSTQPSTDEHDAGDEHTGRGAVRMGPLVTASATGQLLANAGPIAIALLAAPAQQALTGRFVAAVTVARIPLFLFAAVQAVFLPALAAMVAQRDAVGFGQAIRRALTATSALGIVGTAGIIAAGPFALGLLYGSDFVVDRWVMGLVAASGGLFMLAQVFALGLLAHHADRDAAIGWTVGIIALVGSLALPFDLLIRVSTALCIGSLAATLTHAWLLSRTAERWRTDRSAPFVEATP